MAEIQGLTIVDASNTDRFPENMAPSAVNDGARALEGILARWHRDTNGSLTISGVNTWAVTTNRSLSASISAIPRGFEIQGTVESAITGSVTLAVNGLAAMNVVKGNGVPLTTGDVRAGQIVRVAWDQSLTSSGEWQLVSILAGGNPDSQTGRNYLINGQFQVGQRGTTFDSTTGHTNNDANYLLDRWVLISDGNDVVDVTRETSTVPDRSASCIRLDVETGNLKFGIFQPIEHLHAAQMFGGQCSLSFEARRTGTSISHLRAAVIAWTGTANSIARDPVGATGWAAAGTDPSLTVSWTYENTPANLASLTTSFVRYTIENISLDASNTTNLGVMIWIDDTAVTVGDFVYIGNVQLERGASATIYETRPFAEELALCQRYYTKTFDHDQPPVDGSGELPGRLRGNSVSGAGGGSTLEPAVTWQFPTTMRTAPTVTLYQPRSGGTNGEWLVGATGSSTAARTQAAGQHSVIIDNTLTPDADPGEASFIHAAADAEL